ncbi:glycosyltransferase involved in cell wall biosynthesis [Flavobacterium sp. PL11]|jgi:glycosyltransferase involved in cell wall biosynthesis|uniref:glycosyltransferase family 2 protein n=1 Tax=Flavobacterium sp. PL11 TaxID=3071717 RepID=UPI002DFFC659|nr:glycosyltransferase involved in cell wall biosynthesis [Flavobacterium sp. PL11]
MIIPTYTIAIPVYMRILGFANALESALSVDGVSEVLVIDDHSNHKMFKEICNTFKDGRIRYIKNTENIGLFANWNKCIQEAHSEFVSILCSDDLIESNAFTLFNEAYQKNADIDVFFGSFTTFTDHKSDAVSHRKFKNGRMEGTILLRDAINNGPCFPVLSIMRKSKMLQFPIVSKTHSGNDWLWIYSNAMSLNLYAVAQTINYWRRHPDQDAVKSQSITTDCWPLMFILASKQLSSVDKSLSNKAVRRAKGVVLSWLINDYKSRTVYYHRILNAEKTTNYFITESHKLIESDWLLRNLLNASTSSSLYYNIGRLLRKSGYYPAS